MTSQDNFMDMSKLELLLREHFAQTEKQIAEIQKSNSDFRTQIKDDMNNFKTEIREDINNFRGEVNARFDGLHSDIVELQKDVEGLKHDVAGLYHWDYWLLSIILVIFAMPQIVAGIKSFFGAIADGLALIISVFRKK